MGPKKKGKGKKGKVKKKKPDPGWAKVWLILDTRQSPHSEIFMSRLSFFDKKGICFFELN